MEINLLVAVLGVIGAGLAAFGGSRIAVAELKKDNHRIEEKADFHARNLEEKIDNLYSRVDRLEADYFSGSKRPRSR